MTTDQRYAGSSETKRTLCSLAPTWMLKGRTESANSGAGYRGNLTKLQITGLNE